MKMNVKQIISKLRILGIAILLWLGVEAPFDIAWIFLGLAFVLAIQYIQEKTNFLIVNGKFLGIFKPWENYSEKEKAYFSFIIALPVSILVMYGQKNPFWGLITLIILVWDGVRHLQKWNKLQEEDKL